MKRKKSLKRKMQERLTVIGIITLLVFIFIFSTYCMFTSNSLKECILSLILYYLDVFIMDYLFNN